MKILRITFLLLAFSQLTRGQTQEEFVIIEEPANFPGGIGKFYEYISKSVTVSNLPKRKQVRGRMYVEFVITEDGTIDKDSIRVFKPDPSEIPPGMSTEFADFPQVYIDDVTKVIRNSPPWLPGKRRGVPVRQRFVVPISFN